ncbi:hypothetical protein M011DRAFT_471411 [Sporormia fimetaria CBS 119925]|uniref:Uncharacterized protein n=1 Tax=Sporormia fimetaria CBS 119925 TaxID=1340428 RepID=A0A6A6V165_9PLEO|nr:hypothetical protein M011DRAFT_471411 [Sporormia fimetaria CBS 119925]
MSTLTITRRFLNALIELLPTLPDFDEELAKLSTQDGGAAPTSAKGVIRVPNGSAKMTIECDYLFAEEFSNTLGRLKRERPEEFEKLKEEFEEAGEIAVKYKVVDGEYAAVGGSGRLVTDKDRTVDWIFLKGRGVFGTMNRMCRRSFMRDWRLEDDRYFG